MGLRPTPATNESAGPFRKVVGTEERSQTYPSRTYGSIVHPPYTRTWKVEMLECGHPGRIVSPYGLAKKRRCWPCVSK